MKLDIIKECRVCGAIAVESRAITDEISEFYMQPVCDCGIDNVTSSMELHTRDEQRG